MRSRGIGLAGAGVAIGPRMVSERMRGSGDVNLVLFNCSSEIASASEYSGQEMSLRICAENLRG